MPCTRTQHGVASADQTQDLSIRSLMQLCHRDPNTHINIQVFGFNMMKLQLCFGHLRFLLTIIIVFSAHKYFIDFF